MEVTPMKLLRVISTTGLFLLVGAAVPAFAQDEHPAQETKPAQQEEKAKPAVQPKAKPAQEENKPKPAPQPEKAKPAAKPAEQPKTAKQAPAAKEAPTAKQANQGEGGKPAAQQHTAAEIQRQHSAPALRLTARGTGRIPDEKFRANFGSGHSFHMGTPKLVGGYSRFQYGGFWFGFVQPWPDGWYYTDAVYVDFIDGGYYLCNPFYPGAQVSISVVL
jgi:hypothetical protein